MLPLERKSLQDLKTSDPEAKEEKEDGIESVPQKRKDSAASTEAKAATEHPDDQTEF